MVQRMDEPSISDVEDSPWSFRPTAGASYFILWPFLPPRLPPISHNASEVAEPASTIGFPGSATFPIEIEFPTPSCNKAGWDGGRRQAAAASNFFVSRWVPVFPEGTVNERIRTDRYTLSRLSQGVATVSGRHSMFSSFFDSAQSLR